MPDFTLENQQSLCLCPWVSIYIANNQGTIKPCRWSKIVCGQLSSGNLKEIWNSPGYCQLRENIQTKVREKTNSGDKDLLINSMRRTSQIHGLSPVEIEKALQRFFYGINSIDGGPMVLDIYEEVIEHQSSDIVRNAYLDLCKTTILSESQFRIYINLDKELQRFLASIPEHNGLGQMITINILPPKFLDLSNTGLLNKCEYGLRMFLDAGTEQTFETYWTKNWDEMLLKLLDVIDYRRFHCNACNESLVFRPRPENITEINSFFDIARNFGLQVDFLPNNLSFSIFEDQESTDLLILLEEVEKKLIRENCNPSAIDSLYFLIPVSTETIFERTRRSKDVIIDVANASPPKVFRDVWPPHDAKLISNSNIDETMKDILEGATHEVVIGPNLACSNDYNHVINLITTAGKNPIETILLDVSNLNPVARLPTDHSVDVILSSSTNKIKSQEVVLTNLLDILRSSDKIRRFEIVLTILNITFLDRILETIQDIPFQQLKLTLPFSTKNAHLYPSIIEAAPLVHSALLRQPACDRKLIQNIPVRNPWLSPNLLSERPRNPRRVEKLRGTPLISIIMPCYNKAQSIHLTLHALASQQISPNDFELILVDDGSPDGTSEAVESYLDNVSTRLNVTLLQWPRSISKRAGDFQFRVSHCRNLAADHARGKFLLFLDSDMIGPPELLSEHLKFLCRGAEVVRGTRIRVDFEAEAMLAAQFGKGRFNHFERLPTEKQGGIDDPPPTKAWQHQHLPWTLFYTNNISIQRDIFEKVGEFDESYICWGPEDVELGYRLWKSGVKFHHNDRAVAYHLRHKSEFEEEHMQLIERMIFEYMYRKHFNFDLIFNYYDVLSNEEQQLLEDIMQT